MSKPVLFDLLDSGFQRWWEDVDKKRLPLKEPGVDIDRKEFMLVYYQLKVEPTLRDAEFWVDEKDLMWFTLRWYGK